LGEPLVTLGGVSHTFSSGSVVVRAVDNVTLTLDAGSVLCLVGESGSGKTTTARIAAGLTKPTTGVVRFDGADIHHSNRAAFGRFRRAVQYIHQDPYASLNPIRDVLGTLTAPLRHHKLVRGRDEARQRAAELLTEVDLTPPEQFLSKFPHQLSGGQRQRVAVARALTLGPRLIIADEATSMLDVSIRISLLSMLKRLRSDLGVGFLFITHDLALARYFGWEGSTAVMHRGTVVEFGPTPDVIGNPTHEYTRALLAAIPEPDPDLSRRKRARAARQAAKEAAGSAVEPAAGPAVEPAAGPAVERPVEHPVEPAVEPVSKREVAP
jgi:peptide/nickel transport system ATP-binding protein